MSGGIPGFTGDLGLLTKIPDLPDEKLLQALDVLAPVTEMPEVTSVIETVRPRLRQLRPRRRLTVKRVLCRPFEDLLVSDVPQGAALVVPRAAIEPCWTLVEQDEPRAMRGFAATLAKLSPREPAKLAALGHEIWRLAARTIGAAERLAGVSEPVALIGKILAAAPEVEAFKQAFPRKPLASLRENSAAVQLIRTAIHHLGERGVPAEGYLLAVAARLESPAELLSVTQRAEIRMAKQAVQVLGGYVIEEVVKEADRLQQATEVSPEDAARDADRLYRVLLDARDNFSGKLKVELDEGTRHVAGVIQGILGSHVIDPAASAVEAALPSEAAPSTETLMNAEAHARALGRSRRLAAQVGLDQKVKGAIGAIRKRLTDTVEEALGAVEAGAARESREDFVYRAIRLTELVAGPQEAERLLQMARRRLTPATAPAAPA